MKRYYYDLHIHSCLSPCADDESTPNNIAGIASLSGLDVIALTDHNATANCPAFFAACERFGIVPIAGMELTTSEDIHVVCLFEELSSAMRFGELVSGRRIPIRNRPEIFGRQLIMNDEDEPVGEEEFLLSNATDISVENVVALVSEYGGICYPAHIDRSANGIIAILGTFPRSPGFTAFELRRASFYEKYAEEFSLRDMKVIISSDAHYLGDIRDGENYFEFNDGLSPEELRRAIFSYLRQEK